VPSPQPTLSLGDAEDVIRHQAFTSAGDGLVGVELEWLTVPAGDRARRLPLADIQSVATDAVPLPHRGLVTIEPGGQLELSTQPLPSPAAACEAAADDLYVLDQICQARGIDLVALGIDPVRVPRRVVTERRYRAMQQHFDGDGPAGRTMMCNTASVQINVGLGAGSEVARRWHVAHRIGPVLLAAFANSGLAGGRPSGWKSARMRAWWGIDATRTAPVSTTRTIDPDPASAWARYALDANVLLVRRPDDEWEPLTTPLPLRAWLENGHPAGWPTADDIAYHLTTLFPPIRPRGWLELRYLDSLPTPYWHVAVAVATVLLDDDEAADTALAATEGVADQWVRASREGLDDPALAAAARACFAAAADALDRAGADDATIALVDDYRERFVEQSWCPADERSQAFALHGSLHPAAESPIPYARLSAYLL